MRACARTVGGRGLTCHLSSVCAAQTVGGWGLTCVCCWQATSEAQAASRRRRGVAPAETLPPSTWQAASSTEQPTPTPTHGSGEGGGEGGGGVEGVEAIKYEIDEAFGCGDKASVCRACAFVRMQGVCARACVCVCMCARAGRVHDMQGVCAYVHRACHMVFVHVQARVQGVLGRVEAEFMQELAAGTFGLAFKRLQDYAAGLADTAPPQARRRMRTSSAPLRLCSLARARTVGGGFTLVRCSAQVGRQRRGGAAPRPAPMSAPAMARRRRGGVAPAQPQARKPQPQRQRQPEAADAEAVTAAEAAAAAHEAVEAVLDTIHEGKFKMVDMFQRMDHDGDGRLQKQGLSHALRKLGMHVDGAALDAVWARLDTDRYSCTPNRHVDARARDSCVHGVA